MAGFEVITYGRFRVIAKDLDTEIGEYCEQRLSHSNGEAERFYRELHQKTDGIRVGIEATGPARWFERLLGELGCELWVGGNRSKIRRPTLFESLSDLQMNMTGFRLICTVWREERRRDECCLHPPRLVHNCSVARIKQRTQGKSSKARAAA
jgi:hypothetical protein